jgi:CheY-like chemotaxis protein
LQRLDTEIDKCRALVVDSNPTSRSILSSQLRDFGVGNVMQCARIEDARKQLEARPFDVVLCEHHFDGADYSAQNLLDDLRRNQLLPLSTVFIIVTGEASYAMVAEAAESALDSYLLKPHTATALGERLTQARKRKKALGAIFQSIEEGQFEQAAQLCVKRFMDRGAYWLYAARIGSELLLRLGDHAAGKALYEAVLLTGALPWARLGIARAQIDANQPTQAIRTLESLICEHPTHVDAYDVMGRVQVEQGSLDEALNTYRKATELTPGSITRLQKHGMLAFYLGDREESAKILERAASIGISSKMFDFQTLVVLAFARFHERDTKGLQRCQDNLTHALEKAPKSRRLQRFVAVVNVFNLMLRKQVAAVVAEIREMFKDLRDPGLDVEAACNMMTMLAQLTAAELRLDGAEDWVDSLAMRFASSRALTELLAASAGAHPPFAQRVHDAQVRVAEMAEQAVSNSLRGDHRLAVKSLIARGEQTLNGKLLDMARMTLQRHHDKIPDAEALTEMVDDMRKRYGMTNAMPTMGQTGRQAGAISLRENAAPSPEAEVELAADAGLPDAA